MIKEIIDNMKILNFKVVGVRGFLTKEIPFRDSVTFLIGINGSGKTTLLELMSGLLTPTLKKLLTIEFQEITLDCMVDVFKESKLSKKVQIVSKKQGDDFIIAFRDEQNFVYESFTLPNVLTEEDYRNNWDSFSELENDFQRSKVYSYITNLSSPVILDLNRDLSSFVEIYSPFRSRRMRQIEKQNGRLDDISKALSDVQEMIYFYIRNTARQQSRLADDFKNKVFDEMFNTLEDNDADFPLSGKGKTHYTKVRDLREALKAAGSFDEEITKLTQKVDTYLADYESTYNEYIKQVAHKNHKSLDNKKSFQLFRKIIMYDLQYDKIVKLADYAKQNMQEVQKLREPLNRFENSVNLFFAEGSKEIKVSGSGDILVLNHHKGAKKIDSIYNLSSGEKQLVILMACLALSERSKHSHVYVVDEPEVSLHISWQEKFVDALLKASPDTQFILATHSPSIIAYNERRGWCEDLTIR